MSAWDNYKYFSNIDKMMRDLRLLCLGLNVPLEAILPTHLASMSDEKKAQHLTQQILFSVVQAEDSCTNEQLSRAGDWLYDIIYYILTDRLPQEKTLYWVYRLYDLDLEIRKDILDSFCASDSPVLNDILPPIPASDLEKGLYNLVVIRQQDKEMRKIYEQLSAFLKENLPHT